MTDARIPRRAQVVLLDDRRLDFLVQPRLLSRELLDMVASHFNLHEKEYFGLYHTDDIGNENWLSLDRRVLDHDLPRYADPIVFYFAFRFYVPSITYFREKVTVEIFYLQAKTLIFKGNIHCESNVVFQLGAYVLQATFGDFTNENAAKNDMKKVPILPTRTLKQHPSITYCEDMVIGHYRGLQNMRKGQAIVEYLNKFRSIPTYGVHYYEVKDKGNIPWWIGMSPKGVGVYDHSDKIKPRKVYKWNQIENLYFKERKFSIEIKNLHKISEVSLNGGRQRSNSLGRRINGQDRVLIHAWYASTTAQAKAMWTMAISQHQFYLDKKDQEEKLTTPRTLEDIANELSRSSGSLNSSMASVVSDSSDPSESGRSSNGGENAVSTDIAQMISALTARKEALELRLKEKIEELRQICFREAAITGEYPPETPYNPNCSPPPVRKRVGTSFTFSDFAIKSNPAEKREEKLQTLERDVEIQSKITDAAKKLADAPNASKNVTKSRTLMYQKSLSKLRTMLLALKRLKENQSEDHGLDGSSLNSYEDDVHSIKPPSSRRSSFEAATGQRRPSNTSSIDGVHPLPNKPLTSDSTLSNEELTNHFDHLKFNETPAFASTTMINEMLYRKRSNLTSQSSNPGFHRVNSNSSISSTSSLVPDRLRPPPPSYSESHFSRRQSSSLKPQERRRGSAPGVYQNHSDRVEERCNEHKTEMLNNHVPQTPGVTKVRYVGGGSPSQSASDCNSDDVQITYSPATSITSDYNASRDYWVSTSSRNRSNIYVARYNYPSKLGIMSNSESTGSYFVSDNLTKPNERHNEKAHLYASTSALNQPHLVSDTLPRSHHSSYSLHTPILRKSQTIMNRFFNDGRGNWPGDDASVESLV